MIDNIADDLKRLSDISFFTIADMAIWCGCQKATMRGWIAGRNTPHPVNRKYLRTSLERLEWAVKHSKMLPIPSTMKMYQRADYVKQVRDYALKEISKLGASGKRG